MASPSFDGLHVLALESHPAEVDQPKLRLGEGITGWVAKHRQPVAEAIVRGETEHNQKGCRGS